MNNDQRSQNEFKAAMNENNTPALKNRHQRRAEKKMFKKELKTAVFDDFVNKTDNKAIAMFSKLKLGEFISFHANSIYSVQSWKRDSIHFVGIRRHDQKKVNNWAHKQKIKNIFFGEESNAVEVYPKESKLTDQANMYWLWESPALDKALEDIDLRGWKT